MRLVPHDWRDRMSTNAPAAAAAIGILTVIVGVLQFAKGSGAAAGAVLVGVALIFIGRAGWSRL